MLLVPYLMAAVRMYEEGFATREAIDEGMKLGCGHLKRTEYAPPPPLKRMVASGRIGRKAKRGFYDY